MKSTCTNYQGKIIFRAPQMIFFYCAGCYRLNVALRREDPLVFPWVYAFGESSSYHL